MGAAVTDALLAEWNALVREPVDGLAVYNRPQPNRRGISLMLCAGRQSLLMRVRRDPTGLDREALLATRAAELAPSTFRVPRLRARGKLDGWHWAAYEAIARRPHGPLLAPPARLYEEISDLVAATLPRPPKTPSHWRGAHGDLTPWNLRHSASTTWLIDWEDACFAPPGADAVFFAANVAAMRRERVAHPWLGEEDTAGELAEAAQFWARRVRVRRPGETDEAERRRLLAQLVADPQRLEDGS